MAGSTGEMLAMETDEQIAIIDHVTRFVAGQVPVLASVGKYGTAQTLTLAHAAKESGADELRPSTTSARFTARSDCPSASTTARTWPAMSSRRAKWLSSMTRAWSTRSRRPTVTRPGSRTSARWRRTSRSTTGTQFHLGVVVVVNLMLGLLTPPLGLVLFTMESVTGIELNTIVRGVPCLRCRCCSHCCSSPERVHLGACSRCRRGRPG